MSTTREQADGPKLLDQVRELIRIRHYSIRTEQACSGSGDSSCFMASAIRSRWARGSSRSS